VHPELYNICQQLQAKGITPSVALLRAKSTHTLSIPEAVKTVKQWNQLSPDEKSASIPVENANTNVSASEPITIENLEKRVLALETELKCIKDQIIQLK